MRRSRSAEGRYCVQHKNAEVLNTTTKSCDSDNEGACGGSVLSTSNSCSTSRRNSCTNTLTTQQVPALKYDLLNKRRKSNASRTSDIPLSNWLDPESKRDKELTAVDKENNMTERNLPNITIEIVDENN